MNVLKASEIKIVDLHSIYLEHNKKKMEKNINFISALRLKLNLENDPYIAVWTTVGTPRDRFPIYWNYLHTAICYIKGSMRDIICFETDKFLDLLVEGVCDIDTIEKSVECFRHVDVTMKDVNFRFTSVSEKHDCLYSPSANIVYGSAMKVIEDTKLHNYEECGYVYD